MKHGRKTNQEERIEIVLDILVHDKNHHYAMDKYQISYTQAYAWTRKYEQAGPDSLNDRRGKSIW